MTMNSPKNEDIQAWLIQSDAEFEQRVRERANRRATGIPESDPARHDAYVRDMHERDQFPVGMLLDLIEVGRLGDRRATKYQLMVIAEAGRDLFRAAICHADATEEFLEEASDEFGPMVEAVLDHYPDRYYRMRNTTDEAEQTKSGDID